MKRARKKRKMSRIVDIEPLLEKYDGMNEGTEFSPIHFINDLLALKEIDEKFGQKKGKWLVDDGLRKIYKCPECGQIVMTNDIEVYRFCHGCGIRMVGVDMRGKEE